MSEIGSKWRMWKENPCWDDLMYMIEEIKEESVRDTDRVPTAELSVQVIAENRGIRKGLDKLLRQIDDILEKE